MLSVEFVEPGIKASHPLQTIELSGNGPLGESGDVQPGAPSLLVEVVRETDVPAGHTHKIHTDSAGLVHANLVAADPAKLVQPMATAKPRRACRVGARRPLCGGRQAGLA